MFEEREQNTLSSVFFYLFFLLLPYWSNMKKMFEKNLWLLVILTATISLFWVSILLNSKQDTVGWVLPKPLQLSHSFLQENDQQLLHSVGFFSKLWEAMQKIFTFGWTGAKAIWSGVKVVLSSLEFLLKPLFALFRGLKWIVELF